MFVICWKSAQPSCDVILTFTRAKNELPPAFCPEASVILVFKSCFQSIFHTTQVNRELSEKDFSIKKRLQKKGKLRIRSNLRSEIFCQTTSKITNWKFSNSWAKLEIIKTCNFCIVKRKRGKVFRVETLMRSVKKYPWNFPAKYQENRFFARKKTRWKNFMFTDRIEEFFLMKNDFSLGFAFNFAWSYFNVIFKVFFNSDFYCMTANS